MIDGFFPLLIKQSINQSMVIHSFNQSINQSIDGHSFDPSINQSINRWSFNAISTTCQKWWNVSVSFCCREIGPRILIAKQSWPNWLRNAWIGRSIWRKWNVPRRRTMTTISNCPPYLVMIHRAHPFPTTCTGLCRREFFSPRRTWMRLSQCPSPRRVRRN